MASWKRTSGRLIVGGSLRDCCGGGGRGSLFFSFLSSIEAGEEKYVLHVIDMIYGKHGRHGGLLILHNID